MSTPANTSAPIEAITPTVLARESELSIASRPMLARDADATYWMARYVERAEHVARLLLVHSEALIDVGEVAESLLDGHWRSVLQVMYSDPPTLEPRDAQDTRPLSLRITDDLTLNPGNPNSLISCLTRGRENARGVREVISTEMWQHLNVMYWSIRAEDAKSLLQEVPDQLYQQIIEGSMLFQGLTDQTLGHGQRWYFTQLGKYFERIYGICRTVTFKHQLIDDYEDTAGGGASPLWTIHWTTILRSCGSIEAYRRSYFGELDEAHVAHFMVLDDGFPRSIAYCVRRAYECIAALRISVRPQAIDPAERILGRLRAQLEFADVSDILRRGLADYLRNVLDLVNQAALAVQRSYFLH
ncbi:alpha-E domain-containing protein [soil metagenome]